MSGVVLVGPGDSLAAVMEAVDQSGSQFAIVLGVDETVKGTLSDGDIRRAILQRKPLHTPVKEVMNINPVIGRSDNSDEEVLALMRKHTIHHLPLVNEKLKFERLITLDELIGSIQKPNRVVLMAGGMGKRLYPLTKDCPKPMLPINGKPLLERIIDSFVTQGFRRFYISVNYMAEMVENYFGDGRKWGIDIEYLRETEPRGTAGSLSLIKSPQSHPLIVMNADILVKLSYEKLLKSHESTSAEITMAVRGYDLQIPFGVISVDGSRVKGIDEKPKKKFVVNAGIYVMSPSSLATIPTEGFCDMPDALDMFISRGAIINAYPVTDYWIDIGRLEEFEKAQSEYARGLL